jgi:hypothetical protein
MRNIGNLLGFPYFFVGVPITARLHLFGRNFSRFSLAKLVQAWLNLLDIDIKRPAAFTPHA